MPDANHTSQRLCRAWDLLAAAGPNDPAGDGLDPVLNETLRRVHTLDHAPALAPTLRLQIREGLMSAPVSLPRSSIPAAFSATSAANGRVVDSQSHFRSQSLSVPERSPRVPPRRRSAIAELATAAIMLLAVLSGLAVHRLNDEPPQPAEPFGSAVGGRSPLRIAVLATPDIDLSPPDSGACDIAPRPVAELRRLGEQGSAPDAPRFDLRPVAPPAGEPVDGATLAAVNATLQAWVACGNAGDALQAAAFPTDGYILRALATYGPLAEAELAGLATTEPVRVGTVPSIPSDRAHLLPDGRVAAVVTPALPDLKPGYGLVFLRVGGEYRIDDEFIVAAGPAAAPTATPAASPTSAGPTGDLAVTAIRPGGDRIAAQPGACYIVVGPIELPPVCDNDPAPAVGVGATPTLSPVSSASPTFRSAATSPSNGVCQPATCGPVAPTWLFPPTTSPRFPSRASRLPASKSSETAPLSMASPQVASPQVASPQVAIPR